MAKVALHTRPAEQADLPALAELWEQLRSGGGPPVRMDQPNGPESAQRLAAAVRQGSPRVVVAVAGADVVGMAVLGLVPVAPLAEALAVQLSGVVVRSGWRRRGVGHALVSAAAGYAEECGVDHVVASVYPHLREANRFYARLGFAPLAVRRVASVPALRRHLAPGERGLDPVVRRRSRARRRSLAVARAADTETRAG